MKRYIFAILIALLPALLSCEREDPYDVSFSYAGIIDREYRSSVGRVIPVTISQSIETDGDISPDGKFFYYTSNADSGNFDIYLRAMSNIITVRITGHPSKDTNPVISPDGETLAFVSFRDDPEGDIFTINPGAEALVKKFVVKIKDEKNSGKTEKLISNGTESTGITEALDSKARNLTAEQNESGVTLAVRDANPAWSPDGKFIAYSRTVRGSTDIWIMKKNGKEKRKLTSGGGDYPSFSPDGRSIVYISYMDSRDGEICTVDTETGKTVKVQSGPGIRLYPCYAGAEGKFIYSLIERDTNNNGKLDLDDRSVLQYADVNAKISYRLTKESVSSFKAKWLPSVKTRDYKGIILYTDISGENINLNMIPETGIIPRKQNAKIQLDFCNTFLEEWDDAERYGMALEAVYFFFGSSNDNSARTYVDRSLGSSAINYINTGNKKDAARIIALLKQRSDGNNPYASLQLRAAEDALAGRKTDYEKSLESLLSDREKNFYTPFAIEDIGDAYLSGGNKVAASRIYIGILKNYSGYERAMDIHVKLSVCDDDLRSKPLSESAVRVISSGDANQRITVIRNLVSLFQKGDFSSSAAASYLKNVSSVRDKFRDDRKIAPVIMYAAGLLYNKSGDTAKAAEEFRAAIAIAAKNDIISHLSNIMLGDIERKAGHVTEAEKYYSEGFSSHSRRFRTENLREKLLWLVDYYEQTGIRLSASGKFIESAKNHEKNIILLTAFYNKKLFPEIYARYAARAHVLYIDSRIEGTGGKAIAELETAYRDSLPLYRMDRNRAALYGLAYIYTRKALYLESTLPGDNETNRASLVIEALARSDEQIEWALFLDDTFIEPYLLKSWNYQYIDYRRSSGDDLFSSASDKYFLTHLWEASIPILEKAVNANDESRDPENEGDLNLNMANTYFLLQNYPRALKHYRLAAKYKKSFGTDIEQALFHFHYGYCCWQNNDTAGAKEEVNRAYGIYRSMAAARPGAYAQQYLVLYRYFALFSRYEGKYSDAIKWYRTMIDFAAENKLEIDRARCLQEIARCCMETGDTESAVSYINQAGQILRNYPDDTRKYYATLKLFGLIPFFYWDMGPDALVIGGSSIFYPLDTFSKKILNLSMLEEIALKRNDYSGAIKQLTDKIKLAEGKDTALAADIRIRSLNNLGYYSWLSGRYADAEKHFTDAGRLSDEKGNRDGMFSSMLNIVNLYSMMIEENKEPSRDWLKSTESAIRWMQGYRETYRELALKQEMDDLEKKAKAAKRDVTAEEKKAAELKAGADTGEVNYRLDIAVSTLKFYRAEILYEKVKPQRSEKNAAYKLYRGNREIFDLYAEALGGFETALTVSGTAANPELQCRLLINSGVCYDRTGEYEKAYVAFLDAKTIADRFELRWLKISANHALGSFMYRSGVNIEKGEASALADGYMSAGLAMAEEHPLLVVSHAERIRSMYREYIQMLIASGRGDKAFTVSERCARFSRISLVNSISPEFKNSYDHKIYYDYITGIAGLSKTGDRISALLISGVQADSPELVRLRKKWKDQLSDLSSMYEMAGSYNRLIQSYLEIGPVMLPDSRYSIYSFQHTPDGLFWWRASGKKLISGYASASDSAALNRLMSGEKSDPVFILLNETFVSLIKNGVLIERPWSAVNTLDRIVYFSEDTNPLTSDVLSAAGFDGTVAGVKVTRWSDTSNPGDYSTVITAGDEQALTGASALFSSGIMPACIIRSGARYDYDSAVLSSEAALYGGTIRMIFTGSGKDSVLADIVKSVYIPGANRPMENVLVCGYIKTISPESYNAAKTAEKEYRLYKENLAGLKLPAAGTHLKKWYLMSGERVKREYYVNLWHLALLAGDYAGSEKVLSEMNPADTDENAAAVFMNICQLLSTGRIAQARSAYDKIPESRVADAEFISIILSLAEKGDASAISRAAALKKPYGTIIPADRYLFMILSYAVLLGDNAAREAAAIIPDDVTASERDMLMLLACAGRRSMSGSSIRFDRISALGAGGAAGRSYGETAAELFAGEKGYDSVSLFPVLFIMNYYTDQGNPSRFFTSEEAAGIAAAAEPVDALIMLGRARRAFEAAEDYRSALAVTEEMKKYSSAAPFTLAGIYSDAARVNTLNEDYRAGYEAGLEAEKLYTESGRVNNSLELLMINILTITDRYREAGERAESLKNIRTFTEQERYLFNIQLTLVELNRLGGLKNATVEDAVEFERLFAVLLTMLKDNPALASGKEMDLMTQFVFDEFINYKMKTGNRWDAHYYNEVKKLVLASARGGKNLLKKADAMVMEKFGLSIPESLAYINISKIKKDLFIWTIDSKKKNGIIIPGGQALSEKIISRYEQLAASGKDISTVSKDLQLLFSPVFNQLKNKKNIIVSCDQWTEKIPFEITGDERMISEDCTISYISTPLMISAAGQKKPVGVRIVSYSDDDQRQYLERAAARESGAPLALQGTTGMLAAHIAGRINYIMSDSLFADESGKSLDSLASGSVFVYVTPGDIKGASATDLVLVLQDVSGGDVIVNSAAVQEINSADFIRLFYSGLFGGSGSVKSFGDSTDALRKGRFRHPSYWSGIRLYVRSLSAAGK